MVREIVPTVAWIVDDTGFPKQGKHSVGVERQYSGTLGKVGNCQIGTSLHLATGEVCMPLDFDLYLPKGWTDDPGRMRKAGVPAQRSFRTKWQIALDLIDRALGWEIPKGVVVSDAFYGRTNLFRQNLIDRELLYVTEIDSKTAVFDEPTKTRGRIGDSHSQRAEGIMSAKQLAEKLPASVWKTIKWRQGTKRRLVSRFASIRVQPAHKPAKGEKRPPRQWLLVEWPRGEPEPTKFWFANLPPQTGLARLVALAKIRWRIEQSYQQLKEELGLDHYEGRGFMGWQHHVTMSMLAYGFLLLETLRCKKTSGLTLPEVRRTIQALIACWTWVCPVCNREVDYSHLSRSTLRT